MGNCIQKPVKQQDDIQNDPDSTNTTIVGATAIPVQAEAKSMVQNCDSIDGTLLSTTSVQIEVHSQVHDGDVIDGTLPSTTSVQIESNSQVYDGDIITDMVDGTLTSATQGEAKVKSEMEDTSFTGYLKKSWNILGIYVFMFDQGTDIYASHQHIINGDIYWGLMTILFFLLPLILNCIKETYKNIKDYVTSGGTSVGHKWFLAMTGICLSPISPFYQIVDNVFNILKGNVNVNTIRNIWFLKLLEALLESLPQASLQLFVILDKNIAENNITKVILDTNNTDNTAEDILDKLQEVEPWQWVTVATSIISLSFMVSANTYLFDARKRSRVVFFFLGIITVLARLAVFSVYVSIGKNFGIKTLWLVPVITLLFFSISVWLFKRFCLKHILGSELLKSYSHCFKSVLPLNEEVHHDLTFWGTIVMSWVLTAAYNSFTLSGLLISTSNLSLAIISVHLDTNLTTKAPFESALIVIPATFSFITNLILVIVPNFKIIIKDWLNIEDIDGEEKTKLY